MSPINEKPPALVWPPRCSPNYSPCFECIARLKDVSAVDAIVFGAAWRYAQQSDDKRLCNASPVKVAQRIGATHNVARRSLKNLCQAGLLEDLTPQANGKSHNYWITDKACDLLLANLTRNGQDDTQNDEPTLPKSGKVDATSDDQTLPKSGKPTLPKSGKHLTQNGQATLPETGNKERKREREKEERETPTLVSQNLSEIMMSDFVSSHGSLDRKYAEIFNDFVRSENGDFHRKIWQDMCVKISTKPGLKGRLDLVIQDYRETKPARATPAGLDDSAKRAAYEKLQKESRQRDALLVEAVKRLDNLTEVGVEIKSKNERHSRE